MLRVSAGIEPRSKEHVVERQPGLHSERDDGGLLEFQQDRAPAAVRTHRPVVDRFPPPPLPHRLVVHAVPSGQYGRRFRRRLGERTQSRSRGRASV